MRVIKRRIRSIPPIANTIPAIIRKIIPMTAKRSICPAPTIPLSKKFDKLRVFAKAPETPVVAGRIAAVDPTLLVSIPPLLI